MHITPFKLERYFGEYEFKVKFLLSPSDCESLSMNELLGMASPEGRRLWEQLSLGYTESQGSPALREAIALMYSAVPPDQILVAAPEEAIFIAMNTLLHPGDEVISIFPAYQSLYSLAEAIGCRVTPWALRLEGDRWALDLNELEDSLSESTRLLVINFPHNPTGFLPDRDFLDAVIDLARQRGIYLFSDEMYRYLEYDPVERLPAVCDLYEKGISLSGLSKTFALPGLRIGWLAALEKGLPERWLEFKDYTTICSSAPSEILAYIGLHAGEAIAMRSLEIVKANIRLAEGFFAEHAGLFQWIPPQGGSIAFPRWTGPGSVEDFCRRALDQESVMVLPGSIFDFPGDHFRVGLGRKNFGEALEKVDKVL